MTLRKDDDGRDNWTYCFTLHRETDQANIKEALGHPTRDEIDDWEDYQLIKKLSDERIVPSIVYGGATTIDELIGLGLNRKDSGYFSEGSTKGDDDDTSESICEIPTTTIAA